MLENKGHDFCFQCSPVYKILGIEFWRQKVWEQGEREKNCREVFDIQSSLGSESCFWFVDQLPPNLTLFFSSPRPQRVEKRFLSRAYSSGGKGVGGTVRGVNCLKCLEPHGIGECQRCVQQFEAKHRHDAMPYVAADAAKNNGLQELHD